MAKTTSKKSGTTASSLKSSSKKPAMTDSCCSPNEKGQGISITTIIIAVLGLIVLVVLIVIFTGQTGKWGQGVTQAQGGTTCEAPPAGRTDVTSIGGTWQDKPCVGPVQKSAFPTYPPDLAANFGRHCCKP